MPPSASPFNLVSTVQNPCAAEAEKPDQENELKLVTPDGSSEPFVVFAKKMDNGEIEGFEKLQQSAPQRLITRQIDTPDQFLRRNGISLRIRATYYETLGMLTTPDINIKTKRGKAEVGMSRGEFEANISHASLIDLSVIEQKYAKKLAQGKLPDLENALIVIKGAMPRLIETFLIDTLRERRVIGMDSKVFGMTEDQKFVGEMLMDKVRYHVRSPFDESSWQMTVQKGRRELELEPLHKPCEFNTYPGCKEHVCHGLDSIDESLSLLFFREAVQREADLLGAIIEDADMSKSERGFFGLDQQSAFAEFLNTRTKSNLSTLFSSSALDETFRTNCGKIVPIIKPVPNINVPWELKAA